jgi:hypothetical protein
MNAFVSSALALQGISELSVSESVIDSAPKSIKFGAWISN